MPSVVESKYVCGEVTGILRDTGSDTICLMVHGFQSNAKSRLMRNYAVSLANQGITSLRVDLYNSKYRDTMHISLDDHIADIEGVVNDVSARYEKVMYIGPSLGGAIGGLISNNDLISRMLLWDSAIPSIVKFESFLEKFELNKKEYVRVVRSRNGIISKKYGEQIASFDEKYFDTIACPYLSICCENVGFYEYHKKFDDVNKGHSSILIPGSSHSFQEWGAEEKLFELSDTFIESILSK